MAQEGWIWKGNTVTLLLTIKTVLLDVSHEAYLWSCWNCKEKRNRAVVCLSFLPGRGNCRDPMTLNSCAARRNWTLLLSLSVHVQKSWNCWMIVIHVQSYVVRLVATHSTAHHSCGGPWGCSNYWFQLCHFQGSDVWKQFMYQSVCTCACMVSGRGGEIALT